MKTIFKHLKENWIRHGFETLAVLVGVLTAFALNSWYEGRKDRADELKLLRELRSDLMSNYEELELEGREMLAKVPYIDSTIFRLENGLEFGSNMGVFLTRPPGFFNSANTAYKMIESGGLGVLSNDSLRIRVTNMYDHHFYNVLKRENLVFEYFRDEVNPFKAQHFKHIDDISIYRIEPWDPDELRTSREFRSILFRLRDYYRGMGAFRTGRIHKELGEIIEMTEEEIARLEK